MPLRRPGLLICAGPWRPNDLFGVSSKIKGDVPKLSSWTTKIALKLDDSSPAIRKAVDAMLNAAPRR